MKQQQPEQPKKTIHRYRITFYGRLKNAIGVDYQITAEREGENFEAARLALYDEYEHVHVLKFEDVARDAAGEPTGGDDVS